MNILKINKNSIIASEFNKDANKWEEKDIKELPHPFTKYFGYFVELSEDLIVEDLMKHIYNYSDIIDFCFYSYTNGVSIKEYFNLMETDPEKKSFVDTVVLFWSSEIDNNEYNIFGTFHGIITTKEELEKLEELEVNYFRLELTPINEWKHCKIRIDDSIIAYTQNEEQDIKIIKLRKRWTLSDLLQYFLFEVTCFGTVEDQKKEIDEFDATQKKYESFRVDPDFALKLSKDELDTFIEEIKIQIQANYKLLQDAVETDDFETATYLKKENSELEAELDKMINRLKKIE